MRIALDAMGGDKAPKESVAGAVQAARELAVSVALVGPRDVLTAELARHDASGLPIEVVHAPDIIDMAEHPVQAVRRRPAASMNVAVRLVKDGTANAFVSAGNTGATMAAALFALGRMRGVERPAFAIPFPTLTGQCLVLDAGANVDCRPEHLEVFARLGERYARLVLGKPHPKVALLSNGEEETKGCRLVQEAYPLLKAGPYDFIGNVDGKDITRGVADVIVCDGFVGNVALKSAEGVGDLTLALLREELGRSWLAKLGALLMRPALRRVLKRVDYQEYGGAPLLGVNGAVIGAHGRSGARAFRNAIHAASQAAASNLTDAFASDAATQVEESN